VMVVEVQWRRAYVRVLCRRCGGTVRKWGEVGFVLGGAVQDRLGPLCRRCCHVVKARAETGLRLASDGAL
jgi:hypothetical protein